MRSIKIPSGFRPSSTSSSTLNLSNEAGDQLLVHSVDDGVIRIIFGPAYGPFQAVPLPILESSKVSLIMDIGSPGKQVLTNKKLCVVVDYASHTEHDVPRLTWSKLQTPSHPFLQDSLSRSYCFDVFSKSVYHYVERELWLPRHEEEPKTIEAIAKLSAVKDEFIYGLGETTGSLVKESRRYTLEPRDSLGYNPSSGDGMYKFLPFYIVYKKSQNLWFGVYYNTKVSCTFDMGSETDALFGSFRSFRADNGPLDYYVILADGTLPSVVEAYAKLVTPTLKSSAVDLTRKWASSPTLPPLSQFGYLASSLGLAAQHDAQPAILDFVKTCRSKGIPLDGLHLSSGWCQDEVTDVRNVFSWNKARYPDPHALGQTLEGDIKDNFSYGNVKIIANVKPWVLDQHPGRAQISNAVFVQADYGGGKRDGSEASRAPEKSLLWSKGLGDHGSGSYIDFSSRDGIAWWKEQLTEQLLKNSLTGVWIDNNEFSGLIDDNATYCGDIPFWGHPGHDEAGEVGVRMGWGAFPVSVGEAGRAAQTMGMAKATYEALIAYQPDRRPVIVSRSGVPGVQVYAHGSWSGDNITSWSSLRHSTAMTLSVGLSFGTGLYGHDIGGFAPSYLSPSPELLLRWFQHGAWHTRFVVHSWKEIDTTLWMYDDVELDGVNVGKALRDVVAFRYKLLPMFYSLYVSHYHRRSWPVVKPMLWYHSLDPLTLTLQDQFVFGSHLLIAPVVENGDRMKIVYLPAKANDEEGPLWWCELDTGIWHPLSSDLSGKFVVVDAPLDRTPTFVRAGGIVLLGGECKHSVVDGGQERTVILFPAPNIPSASIPSGHMSGSFTLIEDDGYSNNHTIKDGFTEILIIFSASEGMSDQIVVDYQVLHAGYRIPYDAINVRLPHGDQRIIVGAPGKTVNDVYDKTTGIHVWTLSISLESRE